MICMTCGAEMILMSVAQDGTIPIRGFEQKTFKCPGCHDIEQRLVFTSHNDEEQITEQEQDQ